jgi:short-subunit dehydrogenase
LKRAIVVGASSGIGRALALVLAREGYAVGLAARRMELLEQLRTEIGGHSFVKRMDLSDAAGAMAATSELMDEMGGCDLLVVSSGTGYLNPELDWPKEQETIQVNVEGFAAVANVAVRRFEAHGGGHLVSISSVAALRASGHAPAYGPSKSFMSAYMDGLRHRGRRSGSPVVFTDIQPGFVDTPMAKGDRLFWVASPAQAAEQIYDAIRHRRKRAVITRRWGIIAFLMKHLPDWVFERLR